MTKTLIITLVVFVMLQITLRVISETSPYGRCADYVEDIADDICRYRHEHGEWPDDADEIEQLQLLDEGEEMETLYGVPLQYDPVKHSLFAPCRHAGIPFLSWIEFAGYFSGCSSHGLSLDKRYEELYGNQALPFD